MLLTHNALTLISCGFNLILKSFSVSEVDNEFLELYGGLQSHHEEKRQQHFVESAKALQSKTASSNSISALGRDTVLETTGTNISAGSREPTPPPRDTSVGIEPLEMEISAEEVV